MLRSSQILIAVSPSLSLRQLAGNKGGPGAVAQSQATELARVKKELEESKAQRAREAKVMSLAGCFERGLKKRFFSLFLSLSRGAA